MAVVVELIATPITDSTMLCIFYDARLANIAVKLGQFVESLILLGMILLLFQLKGSF